MQNNTFSTLFIGQNLIKLSNIDSTNNFLKELSSKSEPLPEGTVIMADYQSGGRGQRQNSWQSEPGKNLIFSLILNPSFLKIEQQFDLNIVISIALNQALNPYLSNKVAIKWPNDIYYENKKIGGILIENSIVGKQIKNSVIGIGINVNQERFNKELTEKASSLTQILHQDVDLEKLLREICIQIELTYLKLKNGGITLLKEKYIAKLYRLNEIAKYADGNGEFEGVILGVNEIGQLQIENTQNEQFEYSFKEIVFL